MDGEQPQRAVRELVQATRSSHFGDRRVAVAEVEVIELADAVHVRGTVLERDDAEAFVAALRRQAPATIWRDELQTLVAGPEYCWALANWAVVDVRSEPTMHSEQLSQVLLGEAIEVLRCKGDWSFVRLADGYLGWAASAGLWRCDQATAITSRNQQTHVVRTPFLPCFRTSECRPSQQVLLLPFGAGICVQALSGEIATVRLPDGQTGYVAAAGLLDRGAVPPMTAAGVRTVLGWLEGMIGGPYLWGGRTPWGYDCSGLVQVVFGIIGLQLPRDADQQATAGNAVAADEVCYGDLLFFDTRAQRPEQGEPQITHVAIALDGDLFIHAAGNLGGLMKGSLNPHSPLFFIGGPERLVCARRVVAS
ncbi:MAG: C40 family peptidase [Herpetosiphon sp.]